MVDIFMVTLDRQHFIILYFKRSRKKFGERLLKVLLEGMDFMFKLEVNNGLVPLHVVTEVISK